MGMKEGDLIMIKKLNRDAWIPGIFIRYARSHGSNIYYDVLVDGKIELVHEEEMMTMDTYNETR